MTCAECILNPICKTPCDDLIDSFLNGEHYDKTDPSSQISAEIDACILRNIILTAQRDEDFNENKT